MITLYRADRFIGELTSSEEGQVYWIPLEELKTKELATGMEYVLQILESEQVNESYMHAGSRWICWRFILNEVSTWDKIVVVMKMGEQ